jgi:hypothetical protein
MTQNIYDNEGFFAQYSRLTRSVEGLDGAPEWPTLRGMLPELSGCRAVLPLGAAQRRGQRARPRRLGEDARSRPCRDQ